MRGPARRVLRSTAEKIYAVEAVPQNLGSRRLDHQRTARARTRIRALVALGWSMSELGRRIGMNHPRNFIKTITDDTPMARGTVDKIEALYAQLSMTPPSATTKHERVAVTRAKKYAAAHGWVPPLALDDEDDMSGGGAPCLLTA